VNLKCRSGLHPLETAKSNQIDVSVAGRYRLTGLRLPAGRDDRQIGMTTHEYCAITGLGAGWSELIPVSLNVRALEHPRNHARLPCQPAAGLLPGPGNRAGAPIVRLLVGGGARHAPTIAVE
jgi:hypothetical protein